VYRVLLAHVCKQANTLTSSSVPAAAAAATTTTTISLFGTLPSLSIRSCVCSFVLYGGIIAAKRTRDNAHSPSGGNDGTLAALLASRGRSLGLVAGTFTLLWISANLAFTAALGRTSSASAVTIASTSAGFALVASVTAGVEEFSQRKAVAVTVCVIGTALTAAADSSNNGEGHDSQLFGDALALSSAAM